MNNLKRIIATIIGITLINVFTGCVSPFTTRVEVTHDYARYVNLSKQEAIQLLSRQKWGDQTIQRVDETGFSCEVYRQITDREEHDSYKTIRYYHYGNISTGTVNFADITRIQLLTYADHCAIRLYRNGKLGGWMIHYMVCDNNPEIYNKLLSAFLVLCPNIK